MEKITVFRGVINGQEFNSVKDYNARMNELVNAGVENIEASSSTSVKVVSTEDDKPSCEDTCATASTYDEDASFYPYMDGDDPYYLDLLVTDDPQVNDEALKTMDDVFRESWRYITDTLVDPDICQTTRRDYLNDVQEIISGFKEDAKNTKKTIDSVVRKQADLRKELESLEKSEIILRSALPVIEKLDEFYRAVESKTLETIAEFSNKQKKCENTCKCGGDCQCDGTCQHGTCQHGTLTECTETEKSKVYDLNSIIDTIFGASLFNRPNTKRTLP